MRLSDPIGTPLGGLTQTFTTEEILFWINEDHDTAEFVVSVLNDLIRL